MEKLYQLKVSPIVRAIQFRSDIDEVKEFLLGSGSKIYHDDFDDTILIDGIALENDDFIVETDNGIEIMDKESFNDKYKRIY